MSEDLVLKAIVFKARAEGDHGLKDNKGKTYLDLNLYKDSGLALDMKIHKLELGGIVPFKGDDFLELHYNKMIRLDPDSGFEELTIDKLKEMNKLLTPKEIHQTYEGRTIFVYRP